MISKFPKLSLSALIGIVLGGGLIIFAEPETAAGASVLGAIGLIPSLIVGHLILKRSKSKQSSKSSDSNNDA
ncbi:MAG: hypothetical protein GXP09_00980 [Gammaproteobacteria bacterium]|nr:hypothetical protein [Gammaproteobacteria bacterium]